MKCDRPICPQTLWLIGAGWFLLALFVGETELLASLPSIGPQVIIIAITTLLLALYFGSKALKNAVDHWDVRWLLAVHLARFVGIYFLLLSHRGELDAKFAVPAGWGDIVVAVGAFSLLVTGGGPRRALLLWNGLGMIDILFVVGRAASLRLGSPEALSSFTKLPLSFLPTIIVPLLIATHVVLFARFLATRPEEPGSIEAQTA